VVAATTFITCDYGDKLVGTSGDDDLVGGDDFIVGGPGNDRIEGEGILGQAGDDTIVGGNDTLFGHRAGAGARSGGARGALCHGPAP